MPIHATPCSTLALCLALTCLPALVPAADAASPPPQPTRGDRMIADYFRAETEKLSAADMSDVKTLADWDARKGEYRTQLLEMLGLDPMPERNDLKATVTGTLDHAEFTVERLHFQSRPGLYVTANLYVPKNLTKPAPAVLYVCGHGSVTKDGVAYGNKVAYQHHAIWFARHGYVCLILDTLQLGEVAGIHHGTHREGMWWWNSRGYTPAGVEAWNCVRALDYLQTRKKVDPDKLGVTGRSGGGAYSWWIAAIDDRIKAAAPVAGVTDLHNHVIDGTVEGHCDCMFMVNTYRWDYARVAALVAPRPLLLVNTDKDGIFPLDGVMRVYWKLRGLYDLHDAANDLGPLIGEGGHKDTQELQVGAFRWFNKKLKGEDPVIEKAAAKLFEPEQLKVFPKDQLPPDAINGRVHETFVPTAAAPAVPETSEAWAKQRDGWMEALRQKCFRGWPTDADAGPLDVKEAFAVEKEGVSLKAYDVTPQPHVRLRLYVAHRAGLDKPELLVLNALDDQGWTEFLATMRGAFAEQFKDETLPETDAGSFDEMRKMFEANKWAMAYVAPRGVGPTAFSADEKRQTQTRRRFMLLGQTLETMQTWDVRRAVQAVRSLPDVGSAPLWLQGERQAAGLALYASLFEPDIKRLDLWQLAKSHMEGPHFLNVLRFLDIPAAVAMAAERSQVRIYQENQDGWAYPQDVAKKLGWPEKQVEVRAVPQGATR